MSFTKFVKAEKDKALNLYKQEKVTNKALQENLQKNNYHAHSTGAFRTQSNI